MRRPSLDHFAFVGVDPTYVVRDLEVKPDLSRLARSLTITSERVGPRIEHHLLDLSLVRSRP